MAEQARTPDCQQVEHRSPVFDPATPDEQNEKQGAIPTLSINATSSGSGELAESTEDGAETCSRVSSTTPSLDEQDAAVQLLLQQYSGFLRESLASEQPRYKFCMGCSYLFSQLPDVAVVVRPRPSCRDHTFCRGCYEAAAGERLAQWPCPECERQGGQQTAVVSAAESHGLASGPAGVATVGGSGVTTAGQRAVYPRPAAGPPPGKAARESPWHSTAAVMPTVGPGVQSSTGTARRPVGAASVRPKVRPASGRPNGTTAVASGRLGGSCLEGAICKGRGGSDGGGKRSVCHWVCDEPGCQFVAQSPRHARRHITTHNSERPFLCKWPGCGYRAKQREHLKTHELTHSSDKPYKCHICDFATKRKEHLTRHIKRHRDSE